MPTIAVANGTESTATMKFIEVPVGDGHRVDILIDGRLEGSLPLTPANGWTPKMVDTLLGLLGDIGTVVEARGSETEPDKVNDSFHQYDITCPNCQGKFVLELGDTDYHVPEGTGV